MAFFEALHVSKNYSGHTALNDVSVHVEKGTVFGLLGPNGAGKTTLIRIINRITAPDSGEVLIDGRRISENDIARIGYLPEERGLYRKMKVGEQALYLARLKGLSKNDALKQLHYWFEKFEISAWWYRKIEELSKGMAQKVQFIISILHDPEILIFDEPFSGFDPVNANLLKQEVLNLKAAGKTIILSTHDMASVEELCDQICLINKSKVVLEGKVSQIREQYKTNRYEIIYSPGLSLEQTLNGDFHLLASGQLDESKYFAHISLEHNAQGNDLVRRLIDKATIHSFREILPSMTEVFIQSVAKTEKPVSA